MLFSFYLPTKNREVLLRRAVESVLTQSYATLELVVVDERKA
jgi:glycosyltransferase involved in cell wall biosynthesis